MRTSIVILMLFLTAHGLAQPRELRGAWYTPRNGGGFVSQAQIAAAMDSLANNNFNTVMFLVWSQGYPLWQSDVYARSAGSSLKSDPKAGTRDLLAEAVAEAHRRGLEIEAWFEYGFVAGYSGNRPSGSRRGPLLDKHPSWGGRSSGGSDSISIGSGQYHYWMSHAHPEVRSFLIDLALEVVDRYDIDAVELDRIRYPSNDWGYDSATVALYRKDTGVDPPASTTDPAWKQWRAANLNAFHKSAYDSIKRHHAEVMVTNAPSHYGSGGSYPAYDSFNQDWAAWVNGGYIDAAHLQQYTSNAYFPGYVVSWMQNLVTDPAKQKKVFPAVAVKPNGTPLAKEDFLANIAFARSAGLGGTPVWYYNDLNSIESGATYWWSLLKNGPYAQPAYSPLRSDTAWRLPPVLISEYDSAATDSTGRWTRVGSLNGYFGQLLVPYQGNKASYSYMATVPSDGWYDVYAFIPSTVSLSSQVPYDLFDSSGNGQRVLVDQSNPAFQGWTRIGSVYLTKHQRQLIVRLSNDGVEAGRTIGAGGMMLLLNRLSTARNIPVGVPAPQVLLPSQLDVSQPFPNPFNPSSRLQITLGRRTVLSVDVHDMLGRRVRSPIHQQIVGPGRHEILLDLGGVPSGTYFAVVVTEFGSVCRKLVLIK